MKQLQRDLPKYLRSTKELEPLRSTESHARYDPIDFRYNKKTKQTAEEFLYKAKTIQTYYEDRKNPNDGLRGLTEELILWHARDAARSLRKNTRTLYKQLLEQGVKLTAAGHVDASSVENASLRQAFESNPVIKLILSSQANFNEKYVEEPSFLNVSYTVAREPEGLGRPILWKDANPYKHNYTQLESGQIETEQQRKKRLEEVWKNLDKQNKDGAEQLELQKEAVNKLRRVRKKINLALDTTGESGQFDLKRMAKFMALPEKEVVETHQDAHEYAEIKRGIDSPLVPEEGEQVGFDQNFGIRARVPLSDDLSSDQEEGEGLPEDGELDIGGDDEEEPKDTEISNFGKKKIKVKTTQNKLQDAIYRMSKK